MLYTCRVRIDKLSVLPGTVDQDLYLCTLYIKHLDIVICSVINLSLVTVVRREWLGDLMYSL